MRPDNMVITRVPSQEPEESTNICILKSELMISWVWSLNKMEAWTFRIKTRHIHLGGSCRPWSEKPSVGSSQLKPSDQKKKPETVQISNKHSLWNGEPGSTMKIWGQEWQGTASPNIWLILPHCIFITWSCFYWFMQGNCFPGWL